MKRRTFLAMSGVTLGVLGFNDALTDGAAATAQGSIPMLPSADEVWTWEEQLVAFGTRYTGSIGQARYVAFLRAHLEALGVDVVVDHLTFTRWEAQEWWLRDDHHRSIPVAYYYPYSGSTSQRGIKGPLVYCGQQLSPTSFVTAGGSQISDANLFFSQARNAVALVECPIPVSTSQSMWTPVSFADPNDAAAWPSSLVSTVFASHSNPPDLVAAKTQGVRAVVCNWTNLSADAAEGQYAPFTTPYQGLPAIFVNREAAASLKTLGHEQRSVTLGLRATVTPGAGTDTLWCRLPGASSDEAVIVNTHTDGPNATEENGGLALLALVRYFSAIPRHLRPRDLIFVFVTGHFQQPQFTAPGGHGATSMWKQWHPDLWAKAVAGITVEHLGCTQWTDEGGTTPWHPTGEPEWAQCYCTSAGSSGDSQTPESETYIAQARHSKLLQRSVAISPENGQYFGEGGQFWFDGISTVSLIPGPEYLLQAENAENSLKKISPTRMYQEITTLAGTIERVLQLPTSVLRP